jgi:predicted hydrocarbon binding protein
LTSSRKPQQIFQSLDVDEKKGIITAYGERFLFIPTGLIHSIENKLTENFGPVTATSFEYEIGKEGGAQYVRIAARAGFDIKSPKNIGAIADRLGTLSGWGKLDLVSIDFGQTIARLRWRNGVSVRNKKGKTPVCHFGRGILTGALEAIFGKKCESLEVLCQGKGDPYCEAVIGDSAEIGRVADTQRPRSGSRR